jgi:hypothetical protein
MTLLLSLSLVTTGALLIWALRTRKPLRPQPTLVRSRRLPPERPEH